MTFVLPYPPSANRYWRMPRALGRPILSAEARAYKVNAGWEAKRQGVRPSAGEVTVNIDVYRPARRGDLDNTAKVVLDALNGIAWLDDSQVVELHLRRFDAPQNPRLQVDVAPACAPAPGRTMGGTDGQHPQDQN